MEKKTVSVEGANAWCHQSLEVHGCLGAHLEVSSAKENTKIFLK